MATDIGADHRWPAPGAMAPRGRLDKPGLPLGDGDQPRGVGAPWILAGWSVAGSAGLFALLLGLPPALGVGGEGAAAGEWDLAFHVAPPGEPHRPTWLRDAPAEIPVTAPGGGGGRSGVSAGEKRAAELPPASLAAREEAGASARSAGAGRLAARLPGVPGLSGPESPVGGEPGDGRTYRRGTKVLEEAHKKGPVKLAPPPRRVAVRSVERSCPRPQYPAAAKKAEKEGSVSVRVLVSETGQVSRWEVLAADPPGVFEKCVQDSIQVWEFSPALDQFGKPIESWRPYSFTFKFQDSR